MSKLTLPTDSAERKRYPVFRGVVRYFAAALAGVAHISMLGNEKHNPGEEMHHARGKSTDHGDCIVRHLIDIGDMEAAIARSEKKPGPFTPDQVLHEGRQMAWRALAFLQELEERYGAPLAPGAKLPATQGIRGAEAAIPQLPPELRGKSLFVGAGGGAGGGGEVVSRGYGGNGSQTLAEIATQAAAHAEQNCWCGDDAYHGMSAADRI